MAEPESRPPIRPRMDESDIQAMADLISRITARPDPNVMHILAEDLNSHWHAISTLGRRERMDATDLVNLFSRWYLTLNASRPRARADARPNMLREMVDGNTAQNEQRGGQRHPAMRDTPPGGQIGL